MSSTIHVPASRVWGYFKRYEGELESSLHNIAQWDECGICVYLTSESGNPCFQVYADDNLLEEVSVEADPDECETAANEIYDRYLTQNLFEEIDTHRREDSGDDGETDAETARAIEREDDIDVALIGFLETVLDKGELMENQGALDPDNELFQEIKEAFLEYLANEIGYLIYRPTICEDVNGNEHIVDYPYLTDMNGDIR